MFSQSSTQLQLVCGLSSSYSIFCHVTVNLLMQQDFQLKMLYHIGLFFFSAFYDILSHRQQIVDFTSEQSVTVYFLTMCL